jgi:hypothetical protein
MKGVKEINKLEAELHLILDSIDRTKAFIDEANNGKYSPYSSAVFGELKHRCVALKQRLTIINNLSTRDILK